MAVEPSVAGRRPEIHRAAGHVTIVGLGAVGGVAAERLVVEGVPRLRLVDRDLVEARNLDRPSPFQARDVGVPKAAAAGARFRGRNPDLQVEARVKDLHGGTVRELVEDTDVVVDGTDNLTTRYVLNEACIDLGIPFLYGAARGDFGMASPLRPPETPCFRCLLPPSASVGGVAPCATGEARVAPRVGSLLASQALRILDDRIIEPGFYLVRSTETDVERLEVTPRAGCLTCKQGKREFLVASDEPTVVQLCGEDAVSIDPGRRGRVRLPELAADLARFARVRLTPYLVSLEVPPYGLSIFPDGRAIVRGVHSPQVARSLYQRYVSRTSRQPL